MANAPPAAPVQRSLKLSFPGERLLVPECFRENEVLYQTNHHEHRIAGDLKKMIDQKQAEWETPNTAFALLSNGETFWLDINDRVRFHGGCAIVKTASYSPEIGRQLGYSQDPVAFTKERHMTKTNNKVQPDAEKTKELERYDLYGDLWFRRRYQDPQDPTYSFIQWMDAKTARLKEKPSAIKLSDITTQLQSLGEVVKSNTNDLAELKSLMGNYATLSKANLAQAQSIEQFVKEQSVVTTTITNELSSIRTELRNLARP